jgi:hypothetical protein
LHRSCSFTVMSPLLPFISSPLLQDNAHGSATAAAARAPESLLSQITVVNDIDVGVTDVLTGRGAYVDRFPGNVRFRSLIKSKKKAYSDCQFHVEKNIVAREVIQAVHDSSGRFLKKAIDTGPTTTSTTSYETIHHQTVWVLMEDAAILEKVKQAFRDCAKEKHKSTAYPEKRARNSNSVKKSADSRISDGRPLPRKSDNLPDAIEPDLVQRLSQPMAPNTSETLAPRRTPRISPDHQFDPQLLATKLLELQNSTDPPVPEPRSSPSPPSAHVNSNAGPMEAAVHLDSELGSWSAAAVAASQNPLVSPPPPLPTFNTATWTMSESYPQPQLLLPQPRATPLVPGAEAAATGPLATGPSFVQAQSLEINAVSWRAIPDGFLLVLLGPSSLNHCTLPFTSDDLDVLRHVRIQAETAGDVLCLAKIRAVLQAVMQLPPSRLHLTPSELYSLGSLVVLGGVGGFGSAF